MLAVFEQDQPQSSVRPMSEEDRCVAAAARGDVRAFNLLVRTYQSLAYRTAVRMLGNEDMAADATQQAFISAFRHLRDYRGVSFKAWLLRIVTNACYDQLRDKKRQRSTSLDALLVGSADNAFALDRVAPDSPQELAERRELDEIVQKGLQMIPAEQRATLILADIEEFSYQEIAQITGTNMGTVKSRLARARAFLREFLLAQQDILPRNFRH